MNSIPKDPAETHRLLVSLTLEEIRAKLGDDLLRLLEAFLLEMNSALVLAAEAYISKSSARGTASTLASAVGAQMDLRWQTWERWLPLIRNESFVDALESEVVRLEEKHKDYADHWKFIRVIARDLNRMSEKEIKAYFELHKDPDPKKGQNCVSDVLALDEYNKAQEAHKKGDLVGARIYFQRVIDVFAKIGNQKMLAVSTLELGNVLGKMDKPVEAQTLFEQAAVMFVQLGDTLNLTITLGNLGNSMLLRGDLQGAFETALRGLKAAKEGEPDTDPRRFADLLLQITKRLPDVKKVQHYQKTIQALNEAGLKEDSARVHLLLGSQLAQTQRFDEACKASLKGLKLMVEAKAPSEEIRWAREMHTQIWLRAGRPADEALKSLKRIFETPDEVARLGDMCLTLTREVHAGKLRLDEAKQSLSEEHHRAPFNAAAVAVLCDDLRGTVQVLGQLTPETLSAYEINHRLLILAAELTGVEELGSNLRLSLGIVYDQMGRLNDAAETFAQGAELARLAGNIEFFITLRLNSAVALRRMGDLVAAINSIRFLKKELKELDVKLQQPEGYARVCGDLAYLYYKQEQMHEAEATALDGLQTIGGLGEVAPAMVGRLQRIEAVLHNLIGLIHKATDRYVSAEQCFQRSLKLFRDLKYNAGVAGALANLAGVRLDLRDYQDALGLYNQAYLTIENSPDSAYTGIYTERARTLITANQHAEARRMALLALEKNPSAQQAAKCTFVLLRTATTEAEREEAKSQAELILARDPRPLVQFVLLPELLNQVNASPEQKSKWRTRLRGLRDSFEGMQGAEINLSIADFLLSSGAESEAAIEYLERCLELVDEAAARNQDPDVQRHIFTTGNMAAQRLLQVKPTDNDDRLEIVLRSKARATLNEQFTVARTLEELQRQLRQQPAPVLLVEMYTLPKETLLYFVSADGLLGVEHIPITAETAAAENRIIGRLGDFRVHKEAWNSKTWKLLSEAFTGALSRYLQPGQLVCLIPAGFWHFLPLHACMLDGAPLIETHPVYYGPSSAILSRPGTAKHVLRSCLSVGVEFEQEAAWVADWFGAKAPFVGGMAHPHAVLKSLQKADVVHFSCHGSYNPWRGDESGILLAFEGWLTPSLIEGGRTNADLVTLSACETAFDFVTAANDMVGLDRAFLNMGAVSVLGTLWAVHAEATETFVKTFYGNLTGKRGSKAKHMSKAHALQAAVAKMRGEVDIAHPFYWAPFKLTGGWQ